MVTAIRLAGCTGMKFCEWVKISLDQLGPVVQKPINANPTLKINQGVHFSSPKCCSTLIFGKTVH